MAISNELQVIFNYNIIDNLYDFYLINTSDKYISGGAYILDKPIDLLKAESVVFDNGRSLFLMFKKGVVNKFELINQLIDEKLTIKQILSTDLKDYILFRLFLYSISNFETDDNRFNNIAGKLFITRPKWMSKNKNTFKALNINVDDKLSLTAEAVTFSRTSLFFNKKILNDYPKYIFSNKNGALKRTFEINSDTTYIKKSIYGKKAELPFFDFSNNNICDNKVYFIYKTINLVKDKFAKCIDISFKEISILKSISKYRDEFFVNECINIISGKELNLINLSNSPEYDDEFIDLFNFIKSKNIFKIKLSNKISNDGFNLIYLHNKEYYEQKGYNDPYKKFKSQALTQHITIEDCVDKLINDNESIFNSILKEFVIKQDILKNFKISLDDWCSFNFSDRVIFGKEKNNINYFMIVYPDGTFKFANKANDFASFKDDALDKCSAYLTDNKGKEKMIVCYKGNINVISRTGNFILPSEELLNMKTISRSKESREIYFTGVLDINLFKKENRVLYNAGLKGSGMNTSIPKASILYSIDVLDGINFLKIFLKRWRCLLLNIRISQ